MPEVQSGLAHSDEELRARFARVKVRCQIRLIGTSQGHMAINRIVIGSFLHENESQGLGASFTLIQLLKSPGTGNQCPVNTAVRRRSSGSTSLANQGWRRSQAVLRHEG